MVHIRSSLHTTGIRLQRCLRALGKPRAGVPSWAAALPRAAVMVLVTAAALVLAACSVPGSVDQPEPAEPPDTAAGAGGGELEVQEPVVRIGIITAGDGEEARRGVALALRRRDDRVAGIPVEVVTVAAPSNLTSLAQAVEDLISAQQVHGLIIDLDAQGAAVATSVADAAATPSLLVGDPAGMPPPYGLSPAPPPDDQGRALARHARQAGAGQAAVIYDVTSLSLRKLARAFTQAFIDMGGSVPSVDAVPGSGEDAFDALAGLLASAAERQPDVVLLALPAEAAARAVVAAAEAGLQVPILGGAGWTGEALAPAAQAAGMEVAYVDIFHPDRQAGETAAFVTAYRETYEDEPTARAALAYDAAEMLAGAIEAAAAAGRFDAQDAAATRRAVADALQDLREFRGATGSYTASPESGARRSVLVVRLVPGAGQAELRLAGEIIP
ncbi:MAG: hypothetical protein C0P78_006360 [Bacillota bacterium]